MNTNHTASTCRPSITHHELAMAVHEVEGIDLDVAMGMSSDELCSTLDAGL